MAATSSTEDLKRVACQAIDELKDDLADIGQSIWSNPELAFKEKHAHQILTDFLEKQGFSVERHHVIETGYRAVVDSREPAAAAAAAAGEGDSGPNIAVLCEYDALPDIGHACGHNLIAEAGVGAGVGIKAALDKARETGRFLGKLTVLGTPAEEAGGGKVRMLKAGSFKEVDCAMMAHPGPFDLTFFKNLLCNQRINVTYRGKASHAAGFPWEGINALDAAVMAYNSISALRQQMKPAWRIHGIISNGGVKPNIIPEESALIYMIRTPRVKELALLRQKALACFQGAAQATGCEVEFEFSQTYENMMPNDVMEDLYEANAVSQGVQFLDKNHKLVGMAAASTDFGNVSQCLPGLHPIFYIGTRVGIHQREFTKYSGDPQAQPPTLSVAKALAMTAIDMYCQPQVAHH